MQQSNNIFMDTLSCLKSKTSVNDLVNDFKDQLKLQKLKKTMLQPQNMMKKFEQLKKKYLRGTLKPAPLSWYQNQRKLFLGFFLTYSHLHFKKSSEITSKEWRQFSECFHQKNVLLLRYEAISLQKSQQRVHWTSEQENLLKACINSSLNGKWAEVSRALFYRLEGVYFKTPKQCRQHWFNHLNNDIKKGGWTIDEDLSILNFVSKNGRHWSQLIEHLGRTRTQHMVKNRYSTLLNFGRKHCMSPSQVNNNDENILIRSIIDYLSSHKEIVYQASLSDSLTSQELICKSDRSISIEDCMSVKDENISKEIIKIISSANCLSLEKDIPQKNNSQSPQNVSNIPSKSQTALILTKQQLLPEQINSNQSLFSNYNMTQVMSFPIVSSYNFPYQTGLPININVFNPFLINQNLTPANYINNIVADVRSDSSDSNQQVNQ